MSGVVLSMSQRDGAQAAPPKRKCAVCEDTSAKPGEDVDICSDCAHPEGVGVYCTKCNMHMALALNVARVIYGPAGIHIPHAGMVIRHNGCTLPRCDGDKAPAPDLFTLNVSSDDDRPN